MGSVRDKVLDLATLATAAAAIFIAVMAATRSPADPFSRDDRDVDNFEQLVAGGHTRGAAEPILTLVEFGDYECPACRRLSPILDQFVEDNPETVALVYRHWPLQSHSLADDAARAAECAGYQGLFWEYHDALYAEPALDTDTFDEIAVAIEVGSVDAFSECRTDPTRTPQIARDVEAIRALDALGTPSVIANGVYLATPPNRERLDELLSDALKDGR